MTQPEQEPADTGAWARRLHRWTRRDAARFLVCMAMASGILYLWYLTLSRP